MTREQQSAVSFSGRRCPSIPNSVPKTKFPEDIKTAIQSKVFHLVMKQIAFYMLVPSFLI